MAEPMWLDTNVISRVANGDAMLEVELLNLRNNGFEFWYTPGVERELFVESAFRGKPVPLSQLYRKRLAVSRLGAQVDRTIDRAKQLELVDLGFDLPRYMEGDSFIMSEVAASSKAADVDQPKIFTCDIDVYKNAERWGLDAWTRSTPFNDPGPTHITQPTEEPGLEVFKAASPGAFMGALVEGANAVQVQALTKQSMADAGGDAFDDWNQQKHFIKKEMRKRPGRGCAISFWFWYVQAFDINFPDSWNYIDMSYDFRTRPGPVPSHGLMAPFSNPRGRFIHFDVWLPPLVPAAPAPSPSPAPPPAAGVGPGRNYSPQMDSVEVDVYASLDPSEPKSVATITWQTGIPEGDVTMALQKLEGKNMAGFTRRGEALGWVRLQ
jgi:hypothetical protein